MNKEKLTEFAENMCEILNIQLALEDYGLHTNGKENINLLNEAYSEIHNLRVKRDKLNDEKTLVNESKNLLKKLYEILDKIGKEKFIFYDEGGINYDWNKNKLEGDVKNG